MLSRDDVDAARSTAFEFQGWWREAEGANYFLYVDNLNEWPPKVLRFIRLADKHAHLCLQDVITDEGMTVHYECLEVINELQALAHLGSQ